MVMSAMTVTVTVAVAVPGVVVPGVIVMLVGGVFGMPVIRVTVRGR
jgi:hypothetical protein